MSDIFNEVEEELRRDKYNTLLRRYGLGVAGVALVIVLVVAGYELAWQPWQESRRGAAAEAYSKAVEAVQNGDTTALEGVASGEHDGYAALALMALGAQALDSGDAARAASYYDSGAEKADDGALAGLARIRALYALSGELSFGELVSRAEPLAREGNPYRFSARELIGLGALRAGDLERARSEFEYLTLAPQTPPGIRRRAQEALAAVDRAEAGIEPAGGGGAAPAAQMNNVSAATGTDAPASGEAASDTAGGAETPAAAEQES